MFYRDRNWLRFLTRCVLRLPLLRAYQKAGVNQESFVTAACDFLLDPPLSGFQQTPTPLLRGAAVVESGRDLGCKT